MGETRQKLHIRINDCRKKIKNRDTKTQVTEHFSEVGEHFSGENHSFSDLAVLELKRNVKNIFKLWAWEQKFITFQDTTNQGFNTEHCLHGPLKSTWSSLIFLHSTNDNNPLEWSCSSTCQVLLSAEYLPSINHLIMSLIPCKKQELLCGISFIGPAAWINFSVDLQCSCPRLCSIPCIVHAVSGFFCFFFLRDLKKGTSYPQHVYISRNFTLGKKK